MTKTLDRYEMSSEENLKNYYIFETLKILNEVQNVKILEYFYLFIKEAVRRWR